jgi:hypothetical protein
LRLPVGPAWLGADLRWFGREADHAEGDDGEETCDRQEGLVVAFGEGVDSAGPRAGAGVGPNDVVPETQALEFGRQRLDLATQRREVAVFPRLDGPSELLHLLLETPNAVGLVLRRRR